MRSRRWAFVLVLVALVASGHAGIAAQGRASDKPRLPAPKNPLAGPYDVKGLGLGTGRTLVVAFAAEKCPDCRQAIPFYKRVMAMPSMDGKANRFVVVAMDGVWPVTEVLDPAKLVPHRLTSGPYPARKLPDVTKAPTVLLLDSEGKTLRKWEGALSAAQQEEIMQAVSKSNPQRGRHP